MKLSKNRDRTDGEREFTTGDLPFHARDVVLYKSGWGDYVIRKFRKEFSEIYVGVEALLSNNFFQRAQTVIIREGGLGLVPVLCALADPTKSFKVSTWNGDVTVAARNVRENYVESRVQIAVEARAQGSADVCVFVHEEFQNQDLVMAEMLNVLSLSKTHRMFFVSHKKKGSELLLENLSAVPGITVNIIARGTGGARVYEICGQAPTLSPTINTALGYEFTLGPAKIPIETSGSLFSKTGIDAGTELLLRYAFENGYFGSHVASIFDLGCGTGIIGITAGVLCPQASIVLSDVDARAVALAKRNVARSNLSSRATVILSDGVDNVRGEFELILSNPPLHLRRPHLIEILSHTRKLLKKGGSMLLVVEDSRVTDLRELLYPVIGYVKILSESKTHAILGITK